MRRQDKERPPLITPEIISDRIVAPDNTLLIVPDHEHFSNPQHFIKAGKTRDWWDPFFYNCLPIVFGNQHGFLMLSTFDFMLRWNGKDDLEDLEVHILEELPYINPVKVTSHFGHGILTVQSRYLFRTPPGINLMLKEPPNYFIHGLSWMSAVVETDNLRRDFTFNIKVTEPDLDIFVRKGTPLGCLLPYPRYFLDQYRMAELTDSVLLKEAQITMDYFSEEREHHDKQLPRKRYMEGIDIYNLKFKAHQKSLDMGKWWQSGVETPEHKLPAASDTPAHLLEQQNSDGATPPSAQQRQESELPSPKPSPDPKGQAEGSPHHLIAQIEIEPTPKSETDTPKRCPVGFLMPKKISISDSSSSNSAKIKQSWWQTFLRVFTGRVGEDQADEHSVVDSKPGVMEPSIRKDLPKPSLNERASSSKKNMRLKAKEEDAYIEDVDVDYTPDYPLFDENTEGPLLEETKTMEIDTDAGRIHLVLDPFLAPVAATQMHKLLIMGAFDGTPFVRYEPNFLIQTTIAEEKTDGRTPMTVKTQSLLRRLPLEIESQLDGRTTHRRWDVGMGRGDELDSAVSSFSIFLGDSPHLDREYTIFGHIVPDTVTLETLDKITEQMPDVLPTINSAIEI